MFWTPACVLTHQQGKNHQRILIKQMEGFSPRPPGPTEAGTPPGLAWVWHPVGSGQEELALGGAIS